MFWNLLDDWERELFRNFNTRPLLLTSECCSNDNNDEAPKSLYRRAFGNVRETENAVVVTAEIPGINKENINLHVTPEGLEIKAEFKSSEKKKDENDNVIYSSQHFAGFYKKIPFSTKVDADNASAEYKNGVLEVTVPKANKVEAKKIEIR